MRIRMIGAPMDLGADRRGVDIGTSAIRYADINDRLRTLGHSVKDMGNLLIPQPESQPLGNPKLKYLEPIVRVSEELANIVTSILQEGEFPLILGGDHSIALGSISGVAKVHKNIGVIWIDAHADFNTNQTTPSGNIHGMILSALAGIGHSSLTNVGGWQPKIHTESIVVVGARDLDSGEQALLREHSIHVFTMSEIDQLGISEVMRQALTIAGDHNDGIHLSLDMDALDPKEAPGVGTPVRGGLTYREAHLAMELIADSGKLISMDVVEVNPILDRENATALLAVELVLSALGKKIL
ncbi:MAG TPA: arginase [Ktedonobacter sp.]|jgi:arginase|nr:arginase [Ktedonobacter sp.]HAG99848.1 arginase [Ktedonobacter sp.]HAT46955.1 arginase [Ktedonobacter sp.]HBE24558.1 arginase [Ktedonobacter sp.]HBE28533.1 arginase [Ktedonobacter sp.]